MTYRLLNCLVLCFILCICSPNDTNSSNITGDLSYLERNFNELYENNYADFWKILHSSLMEAKRCDSIEITSRYLNLVNLPYKNAEFNEFFAESIEKLCLNSPGCFHEANRTLNKSVQKKLNTMLNNPLFIDKGSLYKSGCLNNTTLFLMQ